MLWWKKKEKVQCRNKLAFCVLDEHNYEVGQKIELSGTKFKIEEIKRFSWLKSKKGILPLYAILVREDN